MREIFLGVRPPRLGHEVELALGRQGVEDVPRGGGCCVLGLIHKKMTGLNQPPCGNVRVAVMIRASSRLQQVVVHVRN